MINAFQETGRKYIIGYDRVIEIPNNLVTAFIKWTTYPFCEEVIYDRKFLQALLVLSSTKKELQEKNINRDVLDFISREYNENIMLV